MDEDIKSMLDLKAGNRSAFDRLLQKYEKQLINYIYRFTGSRADAEDLAQETFLKVYNAAPSYAPFAKFSTWLYRIASNVSLDYLRKMKYAKKTGSLDEQLEGEDGSFERQAADEKQRGADLALEDKERGERINRSLLALPENQRAAIILKIYEDRPYTEIASIIGVSIPSVESLLFRARQALKTSLKDINK
jgi:RNA polymerase sigma-70 factor (ECF subfamily)